MAWLAGLAAATAAGGPAHPADLAAHPGYVPAERATTYDGATGRFLLDGSWRLRIDRADRGVGERWYARRSIAGWRKVQVPNAWNAGDYSSASMGGGVAWYRKEFVLPSPSAAYTWLVRFESTRYRASAWLNGHPLGGHTGGYVPFELRLHALSRAGVNRLVVRVDNRPHDHDVPARNFTIDGQPNGGWWNYGGLLGDVYLRRVNRIDMPDVRVLPHVRCRGCDARIGYRVTVANYGDSGPVTVTSRFGDVDVRLGTRRVAAGRRAIFTGSTKVAGPHLWSPSDPHLYPVSVTATGAGGDAGWRLETGIRSIRVDKGRLLLNGSPMDFRGAFLHQDGPRRGGAADPARMRLQLTRLRSLGGTLVRTHYPLDPYFHQLADREGVLIWSEIPVYQMDSEQVGSADVQRTALRLMRENILANANHPSVLTWSMGNELSAWPTAAERSYFDRQAAQIRTLDPTRPVSLVILGYPGAPCQRSAYQHVSLLGVNTYFGWYPGPNGTIADSRKLSSYLDRMRACYPGQAIAVSEFGAEANRHGRREERGTFESQAAFNDYTLGVFAKKPWLSGAIGMLMSFHARPGWSGGNPHPTPPMHEKGVFDWRGRAKPAAHVLSAWFHDTQQYDLPGP